MGHSRETQDEPQCGHPTEGQSLSDIKKRGVFAETPDGTVWNSVRKSRTKANGVGDKSSTSD